MSIETELHPLFGSAQSLGEFQKPPTRAFIQAVIGADEIHRLFVLQHPVVTGGLLAIHCGVKGR